MQALAFGGTGLKVIGGIVEGKAAEAAGAYNQAVAERSAVEAERAGAAKEADIREQVRRSVGAQIAQQGASGFQIGQGSALDALAESQVNGMLDALRVRREAAGQAQSARSQGVIAKMTADQQAKRAYFGAASAITDAIKDYAKAGGG